MSREVPEGPHERTVRLAWRAARFFALHAVGVCLLCAGMFLLNVDTANPIRVLLGLGLVQIAGALFWKA